MKILDKLIDVKLSIVAYIEGCLTLDDSTWVDLVDKGLRPTYTKNYKFARSFGESKENSARYGLYCCDFTPKQINRIVPTE